MDDEQVYLEPGFDPSSLTIPRLRSILVAHNVTYPSSAKKAQLIEIFNENVLPQARRLRAANARVKRTSRGIEDVPSTQASSEGRNSDEDVVVAPTPRTSTKAGARRSTRAQTEEHEEDARLTSRGTRHSTAPPEQTPRRISSRTPRATLSAYEDERPRTAGRPSRQSTVTPRFKQEAFDETEDSPFSNENVFQSGNTPPAIFESDRRRTVSGRVRSPEKRQSGETRSWLDQIRPQGVPPPEPAVAIDRRSYEVPIPTVQADDEMEPTEEFTPEEQFELVQAHHAGELVPVRRKPRSAVSKTGPMAILVAMLAGMGAVWRQEKLEVGYCGVGRPTTELGGVQVPEWAEFLRPQCEPCPPHAFCGDKLETICDPDFVLTPHPLSLNGLVPLAPSCEPDSAKARKVMAVKDRAIEELREQNALFECGQARSAEVKEPELKKAISSKRRKGMSNDEFEDLWSSALGEIQRADEVVTGSDGSSGVFTFRSTSLARLPLSCAIRRSLRETLREYFWQLVMVLLVTGGSTYAHRAITTGAETDKRAKELARLALDKLADQAALHAYDPTTYQENYVSVSQLRDDILRDEFSAARRKKLWERVQRKVEGNSNVRPMVREGRSGDIGRVWEWVGAVGMIENTPGSGGEGPARRRSGRVSWGGVTSERLIESNDDHDNSTVGRWKEGGQYY